MSVVVLGRNSVVSAAEQSGGDQVPEKSWTIAGAENLLRTLKGVVSVRIVAKPGGRIEEVHMLTTSDVSPKQTVRNVESALLAHYDLEVDHRCISVAESSEFSSADTAAGAAAEPSAPAAEPDQEPSAVDPEPDSEPSDAAPHIAPLTAKAQGRILFLGHRIESQRAHEIKMVVTLEWKGEIYEGEAIGPDIPRGRMEAVAAATLRAVENVMRSDLAGIPAGPALALDGVKILDALDREYVLVGVHALTGRNVTSLTGSAAVVDSPDRAVILATLQAADRWVRGRMNQ